MKDHLKVAVTREFHTPDPWSHLVRAAALIERVDRAEASGNIAADQIRNITHLARAHIELARVVAELVRDEKEK